MNPSAIVHLIAGTLLVAASIPLMARKVKMNPWYGVRLPAAFASEEAWYAINAQGGRLVAKWGVLVAAVGVAGLLVRRNHWHAYTLTAAAITLVSGGVVVVRIMAAARRHANAAGRDAGKPPMPPPA
ncbi:MAG TPA: SdpI family protein [Opitutaceae bacterium]|nr:SdpI family protein [Opitutaceae bacterium]